MILQVLQKFLENLNLKIVLIIAAILVGIFFFFSWLLVLSLVIASIIVSFVVGKSHIRNIGLELVAFTAIITGFIYGATAGIAVGLILIVFHLAVAGFFGVYVIWTIPEYGLMGYLAATLAASHSITFIGLSLVIGINVVNMIITASLFRGHSAKHLPWVFTNILFNAILFIFLAPNLVQILH
ncbi:MAG: hypothetical protein HY831_00455 [Candidatus Aenigmarchaeota archaeon]|nr:hypothetical protein [Candidatus Aenigmarchaeota archaeon]